MEELNTAPEENNSVDDTSILSETGLGTSTNSVDSSQVEEDSVADSAAEEAQADDTGSGFEPDNSVKLILDTVRKARQGDPMATAVIQNYIGNNNSQPYGVGNHELNNTYLDRDLYSGSSNPAIEDIVFRKITDIESRVESIIGPIQAQEASRQVSEMQKKYPAFDKLRLETGLVLQRNPGLQLEDAYKLASYDSLRNEIKAELNAKNTEVLEKKKSASKVLRQGGKTTMAANPPRKFSDFSEAFYFTKENFKG